MKRNSFVLQSLCALAILLLSICGTAYSQINSVTPPVVGPLEDPLCAKQGLWEGTGWSACGLAEGLFVYSYTDLTVPGPMPIVMRRTYRQSDTTSRAFGPGWNFDYGIFLYSESQAAGQGFRNVDVIMPDGARVFCNRTSTCTQQGCTDYTDATFTCTATPDTAWYAATIAFDNSVPNGGGWDLTRKDGTVYTFGLAAPLQSVRDRYNNQVTLNRGGSQSGDISSISSSNNRSITLTYNASHEITRAVDQAGRTVQYGYDTSGRLSTVTDPNSHVTTYTYSTTSGQTDNLASIQDANLNT
jgi:YD repeat-containing protein